jgi:iron complex outermembrane receptor protein
MKIYITTLLLGFSLLLHAQNSITGIIKDNKNQPLKGVTILVPNNQKSTITNENGKYTLSNLPSGKTKINFSCIGFVSQSRLIVIDKKETLLDITLEESTFVMDEIIISTAFNKLQSQNVMKVDHESLKSMQLKGTATLIEGLATIPGVSQISTGVSIGKPVIRGLSGNRVLVYSQGVRLENQQFGEEHGLGLNDAGIESVEVIKGPASLLYGSDALGGVLYFNPEKFADANTLTADLSQKFFSNTLGSNTSLGIKKSLDNWKFVARGSFNSHADYTIPTGQRVTNARYNEKDFKTGIGYSNTSFSSVLRYNFNQLDLGIPENGIAEQTTTKKTAFPSQAIDNNLLSLNNTFFFKTSKLDLDLGYISNNRSELSEGNIAVLHMKLNTLNYDFKYHLPKFGKFETILGAQGMHQTNTNFGEEFLIPDATTNDFGFFGTGNYEWNSNVIQAGLRFDNRNINSQSHGILGEEGSFNAVTKSFKSTNASLGFKTKIKQNIIVRLNVASGFRAPNLAELTSNGVHEGTNRYEIGNNDLKTEQNIQTDLNFEYKNSHFEWFVNGFYNHINNYIYAAPSGNFLNGFAVFEYIQNNARLYGGECGVHFHPHPFDWLHFESNFETVTGQKDNGDFLPLLPANNWSNTIRTEFTIKNWLSEGFAALTVATTFDQNKVSGFETKSNGYTLVNLGIGGKVKLGKTVFELHINGNNLLNKSYIAHLSRFKNDGIPNIGRTIVLGLNFRL